MVSWIFANPFLAAAIACAGLAAVLVVWFLLRRPTLDRATKIVVGAERCDTRDKHPKKPSLSARQRVVVRGLTKQDQTLVSIEPLGGNGAAL